MRPSGRCRRNPAVRLVDVEGEVFLKLPGREAPYPLDALASGVWRLLESPKDRAEVFEALAEAFPDEPPEQLAEDSARVLDDLLAAGLIGKD